MRPTKPQHDRMSNLTVFSDIFPIYQNARRNFNSVHSRVRKIVKNKGRNVDVEDIASIIPSGIMKKSNSLLEHIVHQRSKSRPDITGTQRMTIYFSDQSPRALAATHHCDLRTVYRIQQSPFSAFGLTYRQFKHFLCDILDDSCKSFYSQVSRVPVVLPALPDNFRPGPKSRLASLHRSLIRAILVHKSELYLDQILSFLVFIDPSTVCSLSSVSRTLSKMGFSCKVPNRVLSRSDYTEAILFRNIFRSTPFYSFQLVFLDESSNSRKLGIHLRGRAPRSVTPISRSRNTGNRFTCIGAITIDGLLYGELLPGALNNEVFNRILHENLFPLMNPYPKCNSVLILDNCRAHNVSPQEIFNKYGILVLFLPPYSPFLNPIERLFAALKAKIKRLIYDNPSLRNKPQLLWVESMRYCSLNFDFKRVIESTYVPDEITERIDVRI